MKQKMAQKRLLLMVWGLLLGVSMQASFIENITIDNFAYQLFDDGTAIIYVRDKSIVDGSVVIPDKITYSDVNYTVTSIGREAFSNCTGLTSITIPNSVINIGNSAFYKCSGLTSLVIPNSVTNVDWHAFSGCTGLTSVLLSDNLIVIDRNVFQECTSLTSIIIPNSVTAIESLAFSKCAALTLVTIPCSVRNIASRSFYYCANLKEFVVSEENLRYASVEGVLFNKDKTMLLAYPNAKVGDYTIPDGVTDIGKDAFSGCIGLTAVEIGNSVKSIAEFAFWNCINLERVSCLNIIPPTCTEYSFMQVQDKAILYVPSLSIPAYREADGWKGFETILGIEGASISEFNNDEVKVYSLSGRVIVEEVPQTERISICTLTGQIVYQGTEREIALDKGIYIIKIGSNTIKKVIVE